MLTVLSHAAAADHVVLVLGTTVPAVEVEATGEYRIDGLAEATAYFAYCLATDALGQPMMNAVAETETAFTTPLGGRARSG